MGKEDDNGRALGRFLRKSAVPFVAKALDLSIGPFAGAVLNAGSAVAEEEGNRRRQRRDAQRLRRLESIVEELDQRLGGFESGNESDERIDLFIEVIEKAILDEDDRKTPFSSAILEWYIRENPPIAQVRILADAVTSLSYLELYALIDEAVNRFRKSKNAVDSQIGKTFYAQRLAHYGLAQSGIRRPESPEPLAKVLIERIDFGALPEPEGCVA